MKLYCGLDIHKKFHVGCIMDETGSIVKEGKFDNSKDGIDGFFSKKCGTFLCKQGFSKKNLGELLRAV